MKYDMEKLLELYNQPFMNLIYQSHKVLEDNFPEKDMEISTLTSIKTGACPENCKYCPQSAHYNTGIQKESLINVAEVVKRAKAAKDNGAQRFCMGAAWRNLHNKDIELVTTIVREVKALGLETCMTLGMITKPQALKLKDAGLDFYNHNLDTSWDFYENITTTRTYDERLETIENVQKAGMKVCCGGIFGMGESAEDRLNLLETLANLNPYPESVTINRLVKIKGTPLENAEDIDSFEFIKIIAIARIIMPKARVRLTAGRGQMSQEMQALCFFAGANSIFFGEKLFVSDLPNSTEDKGFLDKLGIKWKAA
ncbi:MAG: biotin synthase BioB [Alphaproteobacteria bacterium 33-17]|nr:MAG: biotin synthase BioB [Alphaproteobacteria bacterium 33-17]